nr:hypothetical protein CFP56_42104 [Quercus suber]
MGCAYLTWPSKLTILAGVLHAATRLHLLSVSMYSIDKRYLSTVHFLVPLGIKTSRPCQRQNMHEVCRVFVWCKIRPYEQIVSIIMNVEEVVHQVCTSSGDVSFTCPPRSGQRTYLTSLLRAGHVVKSTSSYQACAHSVLSHRRKFSSPRASRGLAYRSGERTVYIHKAYGIPHHSYRPQPDSASSPSTALSAGLPLSFQGTKSTGIYARQSQ